MILGGDIFTPNATLIMGSTADNAPSTSDQVTPAKVTPYWWESPLLFIGVILGLLVSIRIVERKVG